MSTSISRIGGAVAAAAFTVMLVPSVAGAEDAPMYNSISGQGNVNIADVTFHAANTGPTGTGATGYFVGENPAMHFAGPITCLQVEGKRAGFIYVLDKTSQPAFAQGQAILITVADINPGGTGKFGFMPLAPGADLHKCAPMDTPITAQSGHFTVTPTASTGATDSRTSVRR